MRKTGEYQQLEWVIIPINRGFCVATTYTDIYIDETEVQAIVNNTHKVTAEEVISFSLLPNKLQNSSICVMSWFRGSQRARRLVNLIKIHAMTKKQQQDFFLSIAFRAPIAYITPSCESHGARKRKRHIRKFI
jgi:hypothetical protein